MGSGLGKHQVMCDASIRMLWSTNTSTILYPYIVLTKEWHTSPWCLPHSWGSFSLHTYPLEQTRLWPRAF